jgi:hypothetical protein
MQSSLGSHTQACGVAFQLSSPLCARLSALAATLTSKIHGGSNLEGLLVPLPLPTGPLLQRHLPRDAQRHGLARIAPHNRFRLLHHLTSTSMSTLTAPTPHCCPQERWGEAARRLANVLNDDTFRSIEGKSKHQLWLELCDLITKHPADVIKEGIDVDAILRGGIRKYKDEVCVGLGGGGCLGLGGGLHKGLCVDVDAISWIGMCKRVGARKLCDFIIQHPADVNMEFINVDAITRGGIASTRTRCGRWKAGGPLCGMKVDISQSVQLCRCVHVGFGRGLLRVPDFLSCTQPWTPTQSPRSAFS